MAAYFAYSYDLVDDFQVPSRAFKALMSWKEPNFDRFFRPSAAAAVPPAPPPPRPLLTYVPLEGSAALMVGTTSDLTTALKGMLASGLNVFSVPPQDEMCIHYVRIGNVSRTETRSLICLAAMKGWWRATDVNKAGRKLASGSTLDIVWEPLWPNPLQLGIVMSDLINNVVPRAHGVGAWLWL